jgi:hypothetical protein
MGYAALGQPDEALEAWLRERRWLLELDDAAATRALAERLGALDPPPPTRQGPGGDPPAGLRAGGI